MLRSLPFTARWSIAKRPLPTHIRRTLITQASVRGPTEPPLLNQTVGQHFAEVVSKHGDRTAYDFSLAVSKLCLPSG
jgi:hypothetical protein